MSLKQLVIVSILAISSVAFADDATTTTATAVTTTSAPSSKPADNGHQRMWTILAQENHMAKSNDSKTVSDPGVFVTAQRDPHDKK